MSKTYTEIVASMKNNLGKLRSDMDSSEGTVISDLFEVIADECEDVYVDIEHAGVLGSFKYWDKMSESELDDLAYNYGLVRQPATASSGNVYFRTRTVPTTNILIPAGTVVTTEPDERLQKISFTTTDEMTMYVATIATYYNSSTGYYEIAVPAQCSETGTDGNVGVGSIKLIEGSITGIDNCYNYNAFTNAQDIETNEDFADRCLLAIRGVAVGTEAGYIGKLLENALVYDALLVGPGDALMTRDAGLGGKIDLYAKVDKSNTDCYSQTTQQFIYHTGDVDFSFDRIPYNQPIKSIISVVGSVSGPLTENTDWRFVPDTGVYSGSVSAVDKIVILTPWVDGETVTVTFFYYDIVKTLVDSVETVRPLTADVLVKLAKDIAIDVSATVKADSTITDTTALANTIKTEIESNLAYQKLGGTVEQADLIQLIHNIDGVDNITIPLTKLCKAGLSGTADVVIADNEYAVAGTITITVTT